MDEHPEMPCAKLSSAPFSSWSGGNPLMGPYQALGDLIRHIIRRGAEWPQVGPVAIEPSFPPAER
jgi:hypothetical protein